MNRDASTRQTSARENETNNMGIADDDARGRSVARLGLARSTAAAPGTRRVAVPAPPRGRRSRSRRASAAPPARYVPLAIFCPSCAIGGNPFDHPSPPRANHAATSPLSARVPTKTERAPRFTPTPMTDARPLSAAHPYCRLRVAQRAGVPPIHKISWQSSAPRRQRDHRTGDWGQKVPRLTTACASAYLA
ncbi:hypothetical protein C2E23DRAFT_202662 [Lenzites betulinus]|nr:hypothetical protein C2E23DRAFT_202662 [Lenzites betulinus]